MRTIRFSPVEVRRREEFVEWLEQQVERYQEHLERLFGLFRHRRVFRSIKGPVDENARPHTQLYEGCRVADIHVSAHPWKKCVRGQGGWQVAHETVHLIDPVCRGQANVLEEGIAAWFQDEKRFHGNEVKQYIDELACQPLAYARAERLVLQCMPELIDAVKDIRQRNVRISEIAADELDLKLRQFREPKGRRVDRETIERFAGNSLAEGAARSMR